MKEKTLGIFLAGAFVAVVVVDSDPDVSVGFDGISASVPKSALDAEAIGGKHDDFKWHVDETYWTAPEHVLEYCPMPRTDERRIEINTNSIFLSNE